MSSSFMKLKGLIHPDKKSTISSSNENSHRDTKSKRDFESTTHNDALIGNNNDGNSDKVINSNSNNSKQKVQISLERLIRVMEEAEKYDIDSQLKASSSNKEGLKSKQQDGTINQLTEELTQLNMGIKDDEHKQNDKNIDRIVDFSIENIEPPKKEALVYELKGDTISRTNSELLLSNEYSYTLEKFPSTLSTNKTSSTVNNNNNNNNKRNYNNDDCDDISSDISTSFSKLSTDQILLYGRNKIIPDSPLKKENMSSTHSLKFSKTTTTFMRDKDSTTTATAATNSGSSSNNNNKIHPIDNLLKKRAIDRQRSKTLDTSDLKNSTTNKMFPSVPKFSSNKPPPVSGKTRSKNIARKLSLSSHDKNKNKNKYNQSGNSSTINTITSHVIGKIRSNSNSSNSNKSSYISPRTSGGSFTTSEIQQQYESSNNNPSGNNMVSNSVYSLKRRSSSIVNALSSFVNLRSTSSSSDKGSQLSCNLQQYTPTLDDLPTVPEPYNDKEPFESYLYRISNYGKFIGIILTLKNDPYKLSCLNYLLSNYFDFVDDPLDISLRKLLIFLELPKEAQQIDRLLTEFGKIYYKQQRTKYMEKCIWENENQVYFIIFSLLMLHTDYFNPNNKIKMTKTEFIDLVHNDTYSDGNKLPIEILAYYYDNIISKESPKFDCFLSRDTNAIISFDSIENTEIYSPKDLIKDSRLLNISKRLKMSKRDDISMDGYIPPPMIPLPPPSLIEPNTTNVSTSFFSNRPTSNSISSYFPYGNNVGATNGSNNNSNSSSNNTSGYLQDDINIYKKILMDDLKTVSLDKFVSKVYLRNNFALDSEYFQIFNNINTINIMNPSNNKSDHDNDNNNNLMRGNDGNQYDKYLKLLKVSQCGYLRIKKSHLHKLRLPLYEKYCQAGNDNDTEKNDQYYYLKVIRMGDVQEYIESISKQFGTVRGRSNSEGNRFFSLGSSNHNSDRCNKWKDKFLIITTCGLIICDKRKSFNIQKLDMVKNQSIGDSHYIIDFKYNKCELLSVYNLYAENAKNNFDYGEEEGKEETGTNSNNNGSSSSSSNNNNNRSNEINGYSEDDELFLQYYKDGTIKDLYGKNISNDKDKDNNDTCKCDTISMKTNKKKEEERDNNDEDGDKNEDKGDDDADDYDDGDDDHYLNDFDENTFYIWSQYGKLIWRCEDKYERDNWVNSLNLMACIDGCRYEISCIDNTLISQRKQKFEDRYKEIQENRLETVRLFKEEEKILNLYRQCVPICLRTKRELIQNIKQLAVKMEWYDYEIKRDTVYMAILKYLIPDKTSKEKCRIDGNNSNNTDDTNITVGQEDNINSHYEDISDINDSLSFITFN